MMDEMFNEVDLERRIYALFKLDINIKAVIAERIPVSRSANATVFLTNKQLLFCFVDSPMRLTLGDVKKIMSRMGLKVQQFIAPDANVDYLPKTLIFALNETHATNILQIAKEVFGRTDNRFVQKITYSAGDSDELIRQFRNDKDFRIAVTCTLVATGTDIKPLEVVMFMRDVESFPLYIQMKGRGVRTIGDQQLRQVTPHAFSKEYC